MRYRRWFISLAALGLTLLIGSLALDGAATARRREKAEAWQTHSLRVLADIQHVGAGIQDVELGQTGFRLTHDPAYLNLWRGSQATIPSLLESLSRETSDNPRQQANIAVLDRELALQASGGGAAGSGERVRLLRTIRGDLQAMVDEENRLLRLRSDAAARADKAALRSVYAIALLGLAVLLGAVLAAARAWTLSARNRLSEIEARAGSQVELSEGRLRLIQGAGGVGGFDWDVARGEAACSPEFYALLGLAPETRIDRHALEARVHIDDRSRMIHAVETAGAEGAAFDDECRVVRASDGAILWVACRARPMLGTNGKPAHYIGVAIDITDRKHGEEELAAAKLAAESANEAKSQFLANMSHELRTPLNAVIGYSEMLAEEAADVADGRLVPDLQKIEKAGRALLSLVNDVLDLSKIEAGKMDLYLESFEIGELVTEVASTVEPLMERNGNRLEVEADALGAMTADQTKCRQILLNLLSNAAKFTHDGVIGLKARVASTETGDMVVLTVTDSGIGMTAEQIDKLFQPFTQADASTTRNYGGTGLGLALTRRLCEMMGGAITVTSEPGKGSVFTVSLPRTVRDAEGEVFGAEPSGEQPGSGRAAGSGDRRRPLGARPDAPFSRPRGFAGGDRRRRRDRSEARPRNQPGRHHARRHDAGNRRLERASGAEERSRDGGDPGDHAHHGQRPLPRLSAWAPATISPNPSIARTCTGRSAATP